MQNLLHFILRENSIFNPVDLDGGITAANRNPTRPGGVYLVRLVNNANLINFASRMAKQAPGHVDF